MSEQKPPLDARTNAEWLEQWAIDVDQDPWSVPLDALNPAGCQILGRSRAGHYPTSSACALKIPACCAAAVLRPAPGPSTRNR
ncbi:MAG: hypothetical protein U5Q16_05140 [Gammaproteobacteria bacterium]|nr:hypothetical protein [Gammaproteobacteria bacterium]